jgi:hypothetical protein
MVRLQTAPAASNLSRGCWTGPEPLVFRWIQTGKDGSEEATDRDGFRFRGGHPALDLTATLQGRLKHIPRELLAGPEDLARWLAAAGLASLDVACNAAAVRVARELRGWPSAHGEPRRVGRPYKQPLSSRAFSPANPLTHPASPTGSSSNGLGAVG